MNENRPKPFRCKACGEVLIIRDGRLKIDCHECGARHKRIVKVSQSIVQISENACCTCRRTDLEIGASGRCEECITNEVGQNNEGNK